MPLILSRKVRSKIVQNLFWAAIYNVIAIPIAGGILYNSLGILLRPEWAALSMATSTITVTLNALALKRAGLPLAQGQAASAAVDGPTAGVPPGRYTKQRTSKENGVPLVVAHLLCKAYRLC